MTTVYSDIGAYRILREIGRGGKATVFLAEDTRHGREVALKLVAMRADRETREIIDAERWGVRLQERFAETCGLVPRVYEYGEQPPYFFIAMEHVAGEDLAELIERGPTAPLEAARIAAEIGRVLDTAQQFRTNIDGRECRSLVHGDVKPHNVRVSENGDVKVLDFGIAKALSLNRDFTSNLRGSLPYLSPERIGAGEIDARADLWALGVILYELVSGTRPFEGNGEAGLNRQIRLGYPCHPLAAGCPAGLQAIVARLLAPQASDRYDLAAMVREDLERFRQGQTPVAETLGFPACLEQAATRRTQRTDLGADEDEAERTRRTVEPRAAEDATVRTTPAPAAPLRSQVPVAFPPAVPRRTFRSHPVRALLLLAALFLAGNEVVVGFQASRVAATAATRDLDSLDDVWARYDTLSRHSYLRLGVVPLEQTMSARVETLSEQVIANYRSSLPTVRERQWQIAQKNLLRVLVLSPANRSLKAELRYCEGHLHRIAGEAENGRHRTAAARQQFTEAVTAFREAAELRRDWPDPFLGLARVFIYGLEDIDRAADAIKQAQKFGYTPGDRETAQLADGYRVRGDTLGRTARALADLPQEPEYLQRAADAYKQARDLYQKIPAFAGSAANLRRIQRATDQIDGRLADRAAGAGAPWR